MSKLLKTIYETATKLSAANLVRIFLFLFLLISVPMTVVGIRTARDIRSLASTSVNVWCDCSGPKQYQAYVHFTLSRDNDGATWQYNVRNSLGRDDTYGMGISASGWGESPAYVTWTYRLLRNGVEVARDSDSTNNCAPPCSNECLSAGAKQCASGTSYQTCGSSYDSDTCLEWSPATPCPDGQTCSGAGLCSTPPPPPPPCSNECPSSGAKKCASGTSCQTCGSGYDADSCLEWSPATACSAGKTCSGAGICSSSPIPPPPPSTSYLENLQLEVSVPYLAGKLKVKLDVGGVAKEVEVLKDSKSYTLDFKGSNLSLNKEYSLSITSDKTLVRKVKFTPNAASFTLNAGDLILGDLDQDNKVDTKDQESLIDSISSQTLLGDLNADTVTNSMDWVILLTNFGKKGD